MHSLIIGLIFFAIMWFYSILEVIAQEMSQEETRQRTQRMISPPVKHRMGWLEAHTIAPVVRQLHLWIENKGIPP